MDEGNTDTILLQAPLLKNAWKVTNNELHN